MIIRTRVALCRRQMERQLSESISAAFIATRRGRASLASLASFSSSGTFHSSSLQAFLCIEFALRKSFQFNGSSGGAEVETSAGPFSSSSAFIRPFTCTSLFVNVSIICVITSNVCSSIISLAFNYTPRLAF